jgi:hypothetical protein
MVALLVLAGCAPAREVPAPRPAVAPTAHGIWLEAPADFRAQTPAPPDAPTSVPTARPSVVAPPPATPTAVSAAARAGARPIHETMAALSPPTPTRARATYVAPPLPPLRAATPEPVEPEPTATRAPRYSYVSPAIRNGDNKWGVGVYRESNRVADLLRETQPGVILLMDPGPGWARRVRQQHPSAFIVGRRYKPEDQQPLDMPEYRGEKFADYVAELAVPLRDVVDAWMSYNEVLGRPASSAYADYNRFQVAFARRLQGEYGIAAVASNDAPGVVEPEDYPRYFAEAIRASEVFGVHAYAPPGDASLQRDAEAFMLRYRRIHDALEQAGIRNKRMVVTESGVGDGFRIGVGTDEQMASGFAWYTSEMRRDPYMIGQAAFGLFDSTGLWGRYDLTDTAVIDVTPRLLGTRR